MAELDSSNKFGIRLLENGNVTFDRSITAPISKADACNLAAWLAGVADPEGDTVGAISFAIRGTRQKPATPS